MSPIVKFALLCVAGDTVAVMEAKSKLCAVSFRLQKQAGPGRSDKRRPVRGKPLSAASVSFPVVGKLASVSTLCLEVA